MDDATMQVPSQAMHGADKITNINDVSQVNSMSELHFPS